MQEVGWATALFFLCAGSRYSKLYRDTAELGARQGATTRPARGHDTVGLHAGQAAARAHAAWLLGVCHDTKFCIVTGCSQTACDTAQQRARARCDTTLCARDTARSACGMACIMIQFLYREGEDGLVSRHRLRYGAHAPRHDAQRATCSRPGHSARGLGPLGVHLVHSTQF